MDYKYIEQLLDRYFMGETTLKEEEILRAFYAQEVSTADDEEIPEKLRLYAPLFSALEDSEELGDDFDQRMLELTSETVAEVKPLQVKARTIKLTERLRPLFGAAAVVAMLLTIGNAINQSLQSQDEWVDADEYANIKSDADVPSVAYDQVSDSLTLANDEMMPVMGVDSIMGSSID